MGSMNLRKRLERLEGPTAGDAEYLSVAVPAGMANEDALRTLGLNPSSYDIVVFLQRHSQTATEPVLLSCLQMGSGTMRRVLQDVDGATRGLPSERPDDHSWREVLFGE